MSSVGAAYLLRARGACPNDMPHLTPPHLSPNVRVRRLLGVCLGGVVGFPPVVGALVRGGGVGAPPNDVQAPVALPLTLKGTSHTDTETNNYTQKMWRWVYGYDESN